MIIITSNLSVDGPLPANITETTEFYEGDSVYFRMGDSGENVTMRVSIDIDGDGMKEIAISGKINSNNVNYVALYSPIYFSGNFVGLNPYNMQLHWPEILKN